MYCIRIVFSFEEEKTLVSVAQTKEGLFVSRSKFGGR